MVMAVGWLIAAVLAIAWWMAARRRAATRAARIERLIQRADAALAAWGWSNRRQAEAWADLVNELSALQETSADATEELRA
jgi:hypothetical protein